jgi:hypothetical protein
MKIILKEDHIKMGKVKDFWEDNKNTIKNITIMVYVPLLVTSLIGINRINKIIKANKLWGMFYE